MCIVKGLKILYHQTLTDSLVTPSPIFSWLGTARLDTQVPVSYLEFHIKAKFAISSYVVLLELEYKIYMRCYVFLSKEPIIHVTTYSFYS